MKNIFLTGKKHIGKSTLIQNVLDGLNVSIGGYVTERIIKGNKKSYIVRSLYDNKESYCIANIDIVNCSREIFMDSFDVGIVSILEKSFKNSDIIVLDELGFFENDSQKFKYKIYELLDSDRIVFGVIKDHDCEFLNNIRKRNDILLIKITKENREEILNKLIKIINNLIINI